MEMSAVLIALTTTILGGALVVVFEKWVEHRQKVIEEAQRRVKFARIPANIPNRDYPKLIGRHKELADILRVLSPKHRIGVVTIDGVGGIGKTTLALEVAHQCRDSASFEAIVWMSAKKWTLTSDGPAQRMQSFGNIRDICTIVAKVLNLPGIIESGTDADLELELQAILGQRRVLLVLDNLETVEDDSLLHLLRELPAPSKAIVTTRKRINVAFDILLQDMSLSESLAFMKQECDKKSVEIADDVLRTIFRRTGGIPLAMAWSVSQIALKGRSIADVLNALAEPESDICEFIFHEAVRGLSEEELRVLLAVSLFEESADREVIGLVAGLGNSQLSRDECLAMLLQLSLLSQSGDQFDMLQLTRTYARRLLESDRVTQQELMERWVQYYVGRSSAVVPIVTYFPVHVPGRMQVQIRQMVRSFNSSESKSYVVPIFPGDYSSTNAAIRSAYSPKALPDIAVLELTQALEVIDQGLALALDESVLPGGYAQLLAMGFDEKFAANIDYKGHLFGVPLYRSLPVVYYNKEMLESAGIRDVEESEFTWDRLAFIAESLQRATFAGTTSLFHPLSIPVDDWFLACMTRQAGGILIDEQGAEPLFDTSSVAEALEFWHKLCEKGLSDPTDSWLHAPQDFVRGQSAMVFHSSGTFEFLHQSANFDIGVLPLPYFKQRAVEIGGANLVIMAHRLEERQAAAWRFVEWTADRNQALAWAIGTGYLPVIREAWKSPEYINYMASISWSQVLLNEKEYAYPRAAAPYFARLRPALLSAITDALSGTKSCSNALDEVQLAAVSLRQTPNDVIHWDSGTSFLQ